MKILSKLSVIACLCWATLASCESPDYETGRTAQVNGLMSVTIQIPGNPSKFAATKTGPYEENEEIIGSAIGICCKTLAVPFLVIEDVVVKEGVRGKGVGGKLMESLDSFAERKNCAYAILVSSDFRKKAHEFYENHGFTDSVRGFRKVYYR